MIPDKEVKKSRHLTVHQLFEVLQEEFVVCELRSKIYPNTPRPFSEVSHKEYWTDLAQKKKEKIIHIAQKNNLFSIFNSDKIKKDFYERIIPSVGFPNFVYKDDLQRLKQEKWDMHNYYLPKSEVTVYIDGELVRGVISHVIFKNHIAYININDILKPYDLSLVTRILY